MSVWDEELLRDTPRSRPRTDIGVRTPSSGAPRARTQADVQLAAERDAAEIVARARREIRRVVSEARRELLELSAQVEAATASIANAPPPAPEPAPPPPPPGVQTSEPSQRAQRAHEDNWPDLAAQEEAASDGPAPDPMFEQRFTSVAEVLPVRTEATRSARTFVALFTLAGVVAVIGTVLWTMRRPQPAPQQTAAAAQAAPASNVPQASTAPAADSTAPAAIAPAPNAPAAEGLSLSIEARRPTWVRVLVDDEPDFGHTYAAGETRRVTGASNVSIRAGDAGGLLVGVNGGTPAPLGPDGMTLTRRFSRTPEPPVTSREPEPTVAPAIQPAPAPAAIVPAPAAAAVSPPPPAAVRGVATPPATASAPPPPGASVPASPAPPVQPPAVRPVPAAPPSAPAAARPVGAPRLDVSAASRQWLDAYHRQDRTSLETLAAPSLVVNDERRANQRFPFGLEVARAFEDEQLMLSGDMAQFGSRVVERASTGTFTSRVTLTWIRRSGEWQLQEARIASDN